MTIDTESDLITLRSLLTGRLVTPADDDWTSVSASWNLTVRARPAAVLLAETAGDVSAIVRYARSHGLRISLQGVGHGATESLAGTILVRTTGLTDIWIDADARVARLGAGVRWGDLQTALDGTGLTGLVGSNPNITVAGFLLQGGYSWFTREFGSGAGSLRAAEVVDANGERRWTDDASDSDLMWGLRGGGGRFAAVTAVEVDLFPAPAIAGGRLMFPIDEAASVLAAVALATAGCPPHTSVWTGSLRFPDLPQLPPQLRGQAFWVVDSASTRGLAALEFVLGPIRRSGTVVHDTVGARSPSEVAAICEEPVEPTPALQVGIPLGRLDGEVRSIIVEHAQSPALTQLQVRDLGGGPTRRSGISSRIEARYVLMALAIAPGVEAEAITRGALAELASRLEPYTEGRVLPSFVAPWGSLQESYSAEALSRLAALAGSRDERGVFVASLPLAPAGPSAAQVADEWAEATR
jgi:hypothetical protein